MCGAINKKESSESGSGRGLWLCKLHPLSEEKVGPWGGWILVVVVGSQFGEPTDSFLLQFVPLF